LAKWKTNIDPVTWAVVPDGLPVYQGNEPSRLIPIEQFLLLFNRMTSELLMTTEEKQMELDL
jgi:hypothetical protein